MNPDLLWLYGLPCAKCFVPATCHDLSTGHTYHEDTRKPPCQTQIPRR